MPINRTDAEIDKFLEVAPNESAVRVMITGSGTKPDNRTDLERNKFVVDGNGDTAVRVVIAGGATETITTLTDNGDGTFSYTSEDGTVTTISLTVDVNVQGLSYDQVTKQITLTETDGSTHVIDVSDLVDAETITTLVDNGNGSFTYTNEAGTSVTFFSSEFLTSITNTVTGHKIADYTDESGNVTPINETITSISQGVNGGEIEYIDEAGNVTTIDPNGSGVVVTTRTDLISLRNSSLLDLRKIYAIPLTQLIGGVSGIVAYIRPFDVNLLSESVGVFEASLTGNSLWVARYDIDTDELSYVFDSTRNNSAYGESTIASFPFTSPGVTNTTAKNSNIAYTAGTIEGSTFDGSVIVMSGGAIIRAVVKENSNYTHIKGTHREFTVEGDSDVIYNTAGDSYENYFGNSTSVDITPASGSPYVRNCRFNFNSSVLIYGNVSFSNVSSDLSVINVSGSAGSITNSVFHRLIATNAQNISSLSISESRLSSATEIKANGATRLSINRCNSDSGRFLVSAGATLNALYTSLNSYTYLQATLGTLAVNYSSVSSYGYISNQTAGSNIVDRCEVSSNSLIRFLGTSTNCRVSYSKATSSSAIEHRGSSNGCYIYYCEASSLAQIYTNNSNNARMYYCSSLSNGRVYSQGNTVDHYMYYCNSSSSGQVISINNTAGVRMYSISADSQGIARLQNSTAAGGWYYSSFSSYYYAYVTLTTTGARTGMRGYGRRLYTVTNPPNGTFIQNF